MEKEGFIRIPNQEEATPSGSPEIQKNPVFTWPMDAVTQATLRRWLDGATSGLLGGTFGVAGNDKEIQVNNAGRPGAFANFKYDDDTQKLTLVDVLFVKGDSTHDYNGLGNTITGPFFITVLPSGVIEATAYGSMSPLKLVKRGLLSTTNATPTSTTVRALTGFFGAA